MEEDRESQMEEEEKDVADSQSQENEANEMNHRATHSHHENISESDSQLAPDQISVVEGAINEDDPESRLVIVLKVVEGQLLNNVYLVGENGA